MVVGTRELATFLGGYKQQGPHAWEYSIINHVIIVSN